MVSAPPISAIDTATPASDAARAWSPAPSARPIAEETPSRAECGLPEDGFVFGAFNNPEKFNRTAFDAWMRIMVAVPGSVLWVSKVKGVPSHRRMLRKQAKDHGTAQLVEGLDDTGGETLAGKRVVLIDDVATSGGSILKAADQIAAAGGTVKEVAARAIAELESRKALRREHGHIRYLDREVLLELIQDVS